MESKLRELGQQCADRGQWPLVATIEHLLADPEDLNRRINVLGAMHELGFLRNRLDPYRAAWDTGGNPWITRCVERLCTSDRDHWALSALLGASLGRTNEALTTADFRPVAVRYYHRFDKPDVHVAVYAQEISRRSLAPVLEIGWDSADGLLVDVARWRAIILEATRQVEDHLIGAGAGSYFLRSALPYGVWRIHEDDWRLQERWLVPWEATLLGPR